MKKIQFMCWVFLMLGHENNSVHVLSFFYILVKKKFTRMYGACPILGYEKNSVDVLSSGENEQSNSHIKVPFICLFKFYNAFLRIVISFWTAGPITVNDLFAFFPRLCPAEGLILRNTLKKYTILIFSIL